jgi:hypothetical protein
LKQLVVSETATSTWHYHLREVGEEGLKLGGGAPPAICGAKLGWDTKIPIKAWGVRDGYSSWCEECRKKAGLSE